MLPGSPQGCCLLSLNAEGGLGCECSLGRLGRTIFNRFVSNDSAKAGKGRRGHPDTLCCCEDLALLALGPQFSHLENGANSAREMENL